MTVSNLHAVRDRPTARILVVQTAFLGDVVLTTPLLRELRRARPGAHLCVLTTATGRAVLQGLSHVDRLWVLDKHWDREGRRSYRRVLGELMRTRFDAAIAAQRSVRTGVFLRLSGARVRIGFSGAPGAWAYNRRVRWDPHRHAVHRYLELSRAVGGQPDSADPQPGLRVEPAARASVDRLLHEQGLPVGAELLCVAPGSVWPTKRWPARGFARLVAAARDFGLTPVLVGSPGERELCREVASRAPAPILAGQTSIPEMIALLARARMVVGNDSGAAHVASAVGTPVVSVFGSTVPERGYAAFGSRTALVEHSGLACRPCGRHGARACPQGHFRCMREIPAERVLDRLQDLLDATRRPIAPALVARATARRRVGDGRSEAAGVGRVAVRRASV